MTVSRQTVLAAVAVVALFGCGGSGDSFREIAPTPRRVVVWIGEDGLDSESAERLRSLGVDEVVIRRGTLDLEGAMPLLRLGDAPPVEGPIPVGIALEVRGVREGLGKAAAEAVWRGLEAELDGEVPAEVILDMPQLAQGLDEFVISLTEASGVPVVPLFSFDQLQRDMAVEVAEAARVCLVPAFGTDGADLRGVGELDPLPLAKKLEQLAGTGVRVRLAVVLTPRTEPPLVGPGEDLDSLTEERTATVSTASTLDRSFVFKRAAKWSGRDWKEGESVAVRWFDAARLYAALAEIHRLVLPEVAGWDLVTLPPVERSLGLGRETFLRFLGGEGPAPELTVDVDREGRSLRVTVANPGPFVTAVSNHGNWVQISVDDGWVEAREGGSFDRVILGTASGDDWRDGDLERANGVRFSEIYIGPGERITSGQVRLPSSGTPVTVRWHFTLSDGTAITGQVQR
jgi:hypothetical protein